MRVKNPKVTLLYYPPALSHPAGHVAVKVQYPNPRGQYTEAFSRELDFGGGMSIQQTNQSFGQPIEYPLPPPPKLKEFGSLSSYVNDSKCSKFKLLSNNCTDAATKFLIEHFGYERIIPNAIISIPTSLKNQVEAHYSLQKKLDNIFEYTPKDRIGQHCWKDLKDKFKILFKLDNNFKLQGDFQNEFNWQEKRTQLIELMKQNKNSRPTLFSFSGVSERYKKLSEVLDVVKQYANPSEERSFNEKLKQFKQDRDDAISSFHL